MTKFKTLKELFDYYLGHIQVDLNFCKAVTRFKVHFTQKNDHHLNFFTGKLLGCDRVRWLPEDTDWWWNDFCGVDEDEIQEAIYEVPAIRKDFKISSDALNLLLIYLIHKTHHAMLDDKQKIKTKGELMAIYHYKAISSVMVNWFGNYDADRGLAEATYNALSKRFGLKTYKSWGDMLDSRAIALIEKSSPHYQSYVDFKDDIKIMKFANDARGRINNTVLQVGLKFYELKEKQEAIAKSRTTMVTDEGVIVKDLSRQRDVYKRYINDVIGDKPSFIKPELISVVISTIPQMSLPVMQSILEYLSDHFDDPKQKQHRIWVNNLLIYTFNMMEENNIKDRDLLTLASKIRQNFMAGRVNDPAIVKIKSQVDTLVLKAIPSLKGKGVVAERVAVMIYVMLRTFTKNAYS